MFPSIRECTRARWETFPQQHKSKIAIYHRARRSKFEIQNSSFILASLACFFAQFINIDESLNQKHLPCADCFQSIESISTQEIYHYDDSNESSSAASSSSSSSSLSSLSSLRHHSSGGVNRKRKSERSASHRHSINSGRVYTDAEVQERIDRKNIFRCGHLSTSEYLSLHNCSHLSSS